MTVGRQMCPQTTEQRGKSVESQKQRLAAMENDREPRLLAFRLFD